MRILLVTILTLIALNACGDSTSETNAVTQQSSSTAATTTLLTTTTSQAATTTQAPTTTSEAATTTTEATTTTVLITDEQLEAAGEVGDWIAGETLFNAPMDLIPHSHSCATCHLLVDESAKYPILTGISATAASRVEGLSAVDYLRQSIVDPYAFVVDGEWNVAMPYQYGNGLSEDEVNDLVAYLLTR